ncbi:uncharacterized protein VTP21DRAFT_11564 [Calcarisporiella thermophila]|uniref:uncharacterized protein n=1 Tax=Calcarisporiella thermophila TaxID=911321 RepID=UPI0037420A70
MVFPLRSSLPRRLVGLSRYKDIAPISNQYPGRSPITPLLASYSTHSSSSHDNSSNTQNPSTTKSDVPRGAPLETIFYNRRRARQKRAPHLTAWSRTPSAEEAVTNILYNTPTATEPESRHVLNCLVHNESGVIARVSGILAGRGFNIDSMVGSKTDVQDLGRMTIVLKGQGGVVEQARKQLEDLVPVWAVMDYSRTKLVERELLLIKVSVLGPEHLQEQIDGHLFSEEEVDGQKHKEEHPTWHEELAEQAPSDVLRKVSSHLHALTELARLFHGRIVDVSSDCVIIELCAKSSRVDAFIKLVKPFGILECARSGMMAMARTPVHDRYEPQDEHAYSDEETEVDATMLPPG